MRVVPADAGSVSAFTIFDAPNAPNRGILDPITVVTQDFGSGNGRLIIECWGRAWSYYWGAMSCNSTRQFLLATSEGYVLNCLMRGTSEVITSDRRRELEEAYLGRIVEAVFKALRQGVPA